MRRIRVTRKDPDHLSRWTIKDSAELYGVDRWSDGILSINPDGHVCLSGYRDAAAVDIKSLVDEIRLRGLTPPVLIHFTDVLRRRMDMLVDAFSAATRECNYRGSHLGVYPIKVNQHRHVLEDIVALGRRHNFGLECGSKPELLLASALNDNPNAVTVCNGFKDRDYVETALSAQKLGGRVFLVIEKLSELTLILDVSRQMGVEPLIGIRMKLSSRGRGMWESSGGDRSKFGLRTDEILEAVRILKRYRRLSTLQLLHWHIGSQISDIQAIKDALKESTSLFKEVVRLGAPIRYVDAGGGLAVDYDGSHTNFDSSANYTLGEYASDVVNAFATVCNETGIDHPTIITETGRALVAHHSVLVVEVISTSSVSSPGSLSPIPKKASEVLKRMRDILNDFAEKRFQETFHDALEARRDALMLFNLGHLSLPHRAIVEQYFWAICRRIYSYVQSLDYVPEDLIGLEKLLSTTYYCNFSLFQSLPDHWAVKQLFPIMPLHRLDEKPDVEGILADITCDSDGVITQFVDLRDVKHTLPLHPLRSGDPYYLGIFLVGAYQEILGDLHNLFGDTNVVRVSAQDDGYVIDRTVEGETIAHVLEYVQFDQRHLVGLLRRRIEDALKRGDMKLEESAPLLRKITQTFDDYTYYRATSSRKKTPGG
jgi:arginine decarboxylase